MCIRDSITRADPNAAAEIDTSVFPLCETLDLLNRELKDEGYPTLDVETYCTFLNFITNRTIQVSSVQSRLFSLVECYCSVPPVETKGNCSNNSYYKDNCLGECGCCHYTVNYSVVQEQRTRNFSLLNCTNREDLVEWLSKTDNTTSEACELVTNYYQKSYDDAEVVVTDCSCAADTAQNGTCNASTVGVSTSAKVVGQSRQTDAGGD
eukprot:TRINITY_DN16654_c0_g1_i2.p1 TRINITY_DN16654_c0_g1~~TRINITY_DN16654_c0_g1_i2.p1  ORF type:complete len:227 (-),score=12.70 TRINITY_DN16654_c0_g1_i2:100-723(-)